MTAETVCECGIVSVSTDLCVSLNGCFPAFTWHLDPMAIHPVHHVCPCCRRFPSALFELLLMIPPFSAYVKTYLWRYFTRMKVIVHSKQDSQPKTIAFTTWGVMCTTPSPSYKLTYSHKQSWYWILVAEHLIFHTKLHFQQRKTASKGDQSST